jgi:tRNA nucleotidyltransferase (CCA-adding enzyme)
MRIVVGHANPDFDAYASTFAATKLYEGARGVYLGSQNANVRAFHNLHEEFLDFIDVKQIDPDEVEQVVMVDTRDPSRIAEIGPIALRYDVSVIVYDHHPAQEGDITGAEDRSRDVGATTTIFVREMRDRGIELTVLEASLLLLGIHEDTGSLTYPSATAEDADAVAWLMAAGADVEVLNRFLARSLDQAQRDLLGQLQDSLELWEVNGQQIAVGQARADEYVDSAGVLTHYVVEDMGYRVAIALIEMPGRLQVVARSRLAEVDVGAAMALIGGGGHPQAASAGFRDLSVETARERVRGALRDVVAPPIRARDIMSSPVRSIGPETTMSAAGELMARWGHGGLPVLDGDRLVGVVTRKDIDKALRHKLEHAPVKGFTGRDLVTVGPDVDISELERLLATRGVGRVPVLVGGRVIGIVTRKDVLRAAHGDSYLAQGRSNSHPEATAAFLRSVRTTLPPDVVEALRSLGAIGGDNGYMVHVVGGFVRDMVMGRRNLDIDLVVEGDGIEFAEKVAEHLGIRVKVHRRFGTAVLVFSRTLHVDVASSRTEYYTRPGALPTVERSSLRQDLFRRDFTINAMAACLDPACYGSIMDPFAGLDDVRSRTLRVMHALSFVEDPTRILRAARFECRFGFTMDPHTRSLAVRAVELGVLDEVSGARLREELYDILGDPTPASTFSRLAELGALQSVLPRGVSSDEAVLALERATVGLDQITLPRRASLNRRAMLVAAIGFPALSSECERWIGHLRLGRGDAGPARELSARGAVVIRELSDGRGMRDSRLLHLLEQFAPESLAVLWSNSDERARDRIEHFTGVVSRVVTAVNGQDLIDMGAQPGASFSAILAQALDHRVDGRAVGRTAELANLRRLAVKAGLIDPGKESR